MLHRSVLRNHHLSVIAALATLAKAACATTRAARLEGTWDLVPVTTRWPNGRVTEPWEHAPLGRLTYGADGRMTALLMDARRNQADGGADAVYGGASVTHTLVWRRASDTRR